MDFSRRKLPVEAASELRICPIQSVQPYALMLAPVYVFMKLNQKFVSVKAPLDFFESEELKRLAPFETFFLRSFVDSVLPYRDAGRQVRALLSWRPEARKSGSDGDFPPVALPPAPYEVSDAVLRIIGPLWGKGVVIEPFFIAAFANELCDLLPAELLVRTRDRGVDLLDLAVIQSAWAVFLALHLGFCDLGFLDRLRLRVFSELVGEPSGAQRGLNETSDMAEVIALARESFGKSGYSSLSGDAFKGRPGRAALKVVSRLERVANQFIRPEASVPTIFGPAGFVDV